MTTVTRQEQELPLAKEVVGRTMTAIDDLSVVLLNNLVPFEDDDEFGDEYADDVMGLQSVLDYFPSRILRTAANYGVEVSSKLLQPRKAPW